MHQGCSSPLFVGILAAYAVVGWQGALGTGVLKSSALLSCDCTLLLLPHLINLLGGPEMKPFSPCNALATHPCFRQLC